MALKIIPGTLTTGARFKRTGSNDFRCWPAGHAVRYSRSPVDPGAFVVWADYGLRWYVKVPALYIRDLVEEA